jgi:hypothetical protein
LNLGDFVVGTAVTTVKNGVYKTKFCEIDILHKHCLAAAALHAAIAYRNNQAYAFVELEN